MLDIRIRYMRMILPVILMNSLPHTGVQAKEPNILIIQCDQLRAMSIGCYGNTQIRTPNIDSLAARGIRFDQAVTLTPFCAPTRASFQSGLYQHQHRVLGNNDKMADDVICFAEIFADASYVTGYSGKWHLDGDTSGHEDVIKKQFVPEGDNRQGWQEWHGHQNGHDPAEVYTYDDSGTRIDFADYDWEPRWQRDVASEFIRRHSLSGTSWVYYMSINPPHGPNECPEDYKDMYHPDSIVFPVGLEHISSEYESKVRKSYASYYGAISAIDEVVGAMVDSLKSIDVYENTIIIFTSDHGDQLGIHVDLEADEQLRDKSSPYKSAFNIPMIISWPGRIQEGQVCDALFSSVDFPSTVMGLAGLNIPSSMQGDDMSTWGFTGNGPDKEYVYFEYREPKTNKPESEISWWRAVYDGRYMFSRGAYSVLWDYSNDPYEQTNLFTSAGSAAPRERLNTAMMDMALSLGDPAYQSLMDQVDGYPPVTDDDPLMVKIPGGSFEMGDHHDLGGAEHANDEVPVHQVTLEGFLIGKYEISNLQYVTFLNSADAVSEIEVIEGNVYKKGSDVIYTRTRGTGVYSDIQYIGDSFTVITGKEQHPAVEIRWEGAAAYCNWLSEKQGYQPAYDMQEWSCDLSANGYRLPTEAEWEYAGRGGQYDPYLVYTWGDSPNLNMGNFPSSGDPYESGELPLTTPVGFFNGQTHLKTDYNWPDAMLEYTPEDGGNNYGLYDMAGNVWEWINDWYKRDYYAESPEENPPGPSSGSIMPDGKAWHGLRGGNWYNGRTEDPGHARVSNRNPGYYRGPDDPDHAYYHIGFRLARNVQASGIRETIKEPEKLKVWPNPAGEHVHVSFWSNKSRSSSVELFDLGGRLLYKKNHRIEPGENKLIISLSECATDIDSVLLSISVGRKKATRTILIQ